MLRHLDLFSGIGGFALAARMVGGYETVAFCEIEPHAQAVLRKHFPGVPIYDDVRTLSGRDIRGCDVLTAGFPCQDISVAGKGAGIDGERSGLWRDASRLIRELRPRGVVLENVSALLGRGIGRVLGDLAASGYDAEWDCIPAGAIGTLHQRDRVWILAYPRQKRGQRLFPKTLSREPAFSWCQDVRRVEDIPRRPDLYPSVLCRGGNGIPAYVDRIGGLGNAIVPQIAARLLEAIKQVSA